MKYDQIPSKLFIKNRKNFMAQMKPKSVAVFNSNDIYPIGADSTMPFQQARDIFYLTGADQEETILVLFPDAPNKEHREMLFVRETNDHIAVWEGEKLTKEKATEVSGIKSIYWLKEFDKIFFEVMTQAERIYFNTNEHYRQSVETETREDRFIQKTKEKFPAHSWERSNPILQRLRSVKDKIEIDILQQACDITEKGFRRILNFVEPGVWEYEIEAEFMHEFLRNRSRGFAYTPIIASGNNANVLHYIENNQQCKKGDLLLLDVGAEYANYSSDMTKALLDLKLLDKADVKNEDPNWPAYKKYFMHGTSHHIGLDTHDYGILWEKMTEDMVFTVEPGIYIPEEGFGIRLEDDVVIQKKGEPFNLMRNIPIEAEEIEDLMN